METFDLRRLVAKRPMPPDVSRTLLDEPAVAPGGGAGKYVFHVLFSEKQNTSFCTTYIIHGDTAMHVFIAFLFIAIGLYLFRQGFRFAGRNHLAYLGLRSLGWIVVVIGGLIILNTLVQTGILHPVEKVAKRWQCTCPPGNCGGQTLTNKAINTQRNIPKNGSGETSHEQGYESQFGCSTNLSKRHETLHRGMWAEWGEGCLRI
jgi:hypothetical protein